MALVLDLCRGLEAISSSSTMADYIVNFPFSYTLVRDHMALYVKLWAQYVECFHIFVLSWGESTDQAR
jgi:hypothetical protein